ncbi:MAG: alkaline phosphatase family protein [Candidatus Nanohaloarchaea archaeon]
MSSKNILVVAFDGLDYELVDDFDLDNIQQDEFGRIDNKTGMSSIKTSELFASFITGEYPESHGVKGLNREEDAWKKKVIDFLIPRVVQKRVMGGETLKMILEAILKPEDDRRYEKEDLEVESFFDRLENSRAMFVPSYNPSIFWTSGAWNEIMKAHSFSQSAVKCWDKYEYSRRKTEFFSELDSDIMPARSLLMCHFHRPDAHQHFYGDETINVDKDKLRKLYFEVDDLAAEIKEKALEKGYDYVIFMSDHGLVTEECHNENAFYSSNKELFPDKTPHITDFHDRILELVEKS